MRSDGAGRALRRGWRLRSPTASGRGTFIGDFRTIDELGKQVDLPTLVEDEPAGSDPEQLF